MQSNKTQTTMSEKQLSFIQFSFFFVSLFMYLILIAFIKSVPKYTEAGAFGKLTPNISISGSEIVTTAETLTSDHV